MTLKRYTDEEFILAVRDNLSMASCLRSVRLKATGANYKLAYARIKRMGLSTEHWKGQAIHRGTRHTWSRKIPLEVILVENSTYLATSNLKQRLIREGLVRDFCEECGIKEWRGTALSLHLDHKNGSNTDNRLSNLRLLCPNCHSQTTTYAGKNRKRRSSSKDPI